VAQLYLRGNEPDDPWGPLDRAEYIDKRSLELPVVTYDAVVARLADTRLGPAHRQPPVASVANVVRLGGRTGMRDIDRGSGRLGAASVGAASCARSGGSRVLLEHRSINR
jgi:hypothetical protein